MFVKRALALDEVIYGKHMAKWSVHANIYNASVVLTQNNPVHKDVW